MRFGLIAATLLVSSSVLTPGFTGVASAQQQPGINIPLPNIPGVTTPTPGQQQQPYYPPRGQQGYPPQPYDQRGGPDPGYTSQSYGQRCQDLAYQERDIRNRLDYGPPSGQEHDRLVYQLGQVRSERERCTR
jgi:hypothetical protein